MLLEELCMLQVNDQFELSKVSKSSKKAGWNTDLLPVFLVRVLSDNCYEATEILLGGYLAIVMKPQKLCALVRNREEP